MTARVLSAVRLPPCGNAVDLLTCVVIECGLQGLTRPNRVTNSVLGEAALRSDREQAVHPSGLRFGIDLRKRRLNDPCVFLPRNAQATREGRLYVVQRTGQ